MVRRLFVIAGHHRGGTSATAGALAAIGIDFGRNLMPPSPANPRGYFEDLAIVALHDRLLRALGCSWDDPPGVVPANWSIGPRFEFARNTGLRMIEQWLRGHADVENLGVKDPRIAFFPDLWCEAARTLGVQVYSVPVHRASPAVISSLRSRENWGHGKAATLWTQYERALGRGWRRVFPQIPVAYERLVDRDPDLALAPFADLIGADVQWRQRIYDFLDPELNHHG